MVEARGRADDGKPLQVPLREGERVLGDLALIQAQTGELAHLAVVELGGQPLWHELAQRRTVAPESREPPAGVLLADVVVEGDRPLDRVAQEGHVPRGLREELVEPVPEVAMTSRRRLWASDILAIP